MGGVVWSQAADSAAATQPTATPNETVEVQNANASEEAERKLKLEEDMRKFKEEMSKKREARKEAIQNLNKRIVELQEERDKEREERVKLEEQLRRFWSGSSKKDQEKEQSGDCNGENVRNDEKSDGKVAERLAEKDHIVNSSQENDEVVAETVEDETDPGDDTQLVEEATSKLGHEDEVQDAIGDEHDKDEVIEGLERQVKALKDVAVIGGEMLRIRELQVNELKSKLEAIEETGIAYEKEVENMKKLRNLYEERARAMTISHEMELEREKQKTLAAETRQKIAEHKNLELDEKNKEIEDRMKKIEGELDEAKMLISELKIKLAGKNEELYSATSQLAVVNQLFGQLFSPGQDSLEKITKVLEEHHDLVNHLTVNGKINELASTLVEIADKDPLPAGGEDDVSGHLTKVWRLLVELLGHHVVKPPEEASPESCYKSIDTPSGPKLVISVSQTFLRLKDLILEKNSLMKEVGRLKDLNSTLESRLNEQENRLSLVTTELHTTWAVVNKLKRQHQNLHSHEQVLRYELAQKRLLLNDLKKQLEECKDNWTLARAKNSQTEKDWKLLRSEFALRKQQASSAESGYEESPTDSQDEEEWKEVKHRSVSSDEDHCEVLSWNDTKEPRTERRGTLTENQNEAPQGYVDFSLDVVDPCTVLPWTDPDEPSAENSVSEDFRQQRPDQPSSAEDNMPINDRHSQPVPPESSIRPDMSPRLLTDSTGNQPSSSGIPLADEALARLSELPEGAGPSSSQSSSNLARDTAASKDKAVSSSAISSSSLPFDPAASRLSSPYPSYSSPSPMDGIPSTSKSPGSPEPSTSCQPRQRTAEEILQARQDRLRRLEEGCKGLFSKMSQTNQRSEVINSRLTELHEIYGEDSRTRRESPETTEAIQEEPVLGSWTSESRIQETGTPNSVPALESGAVSASCPPPPPFPPRPLYLPSTQSQSTIHRPVSPEQPDDSNR